MTNLDRKSFYIPILMGIIFFFLVVGIGPLDPQNLSWIFGRFDPPQHYLGWSFYRSSPWSLPIGSNPNYGIDIGSSIVYSDSIPIMAIFFKLLSPFLGSPFQYFGIWLLICFVLQAWFSWKIVSLFSNNTLVVLFGSGLLAFAPPMLWRLDTPSGMQAGLVAHFLILAAIYLSLRPSSTLRTPYWTLVLSTAALTHFYIFAMVGALWLASVLDALISRHQITFRQALSELLIVIATVLLVAWQAGYFMISGAAGADWGYGFFKLNLLSPLDPSGWSFFLPTIPIPSTWGEGFNYLGLGAILAISFAYIYLLFFSLTRPSKRLSTLREAITPLTKYRFLLLCLLLLFLDALSNNIGIGTKEISFQLPDSLFALLSILRSSARMYWPIHYCLIIAAIYCIIGYIPTRYATILLGFFLMAQIVDTSKGWLTIKKGLARDMSHKIFSPLLKDPFWQSSTNHYKEIIRIPADNQTLNWIEFASLASHYRIATNSIFLARVDKQQLLNANGKLRQLVKVGDYDPNALYILEKNFIVPALLTAGANDVIANIDGFTVLAPGWLECKTCPPIAKDKLIKIEQFIPSSKDRLKFSDQSQDQRSIFYLGEGWSWQESWGTWSDGMIAAINIPWPKQIPRTVKLDFKAFVMTDKHPEQDIEIFVNGALFTKLELNQFDNNSIVIPISKEMLNQLFLSIEFKMKNPGQPSKMINGNKDQRKLGIGLISMKFD